MNAEAGNVKTASMATATPLKLRNLLGANVHGLGQRVEVLFQQREAHVCVGGVVPAVVELAWVFL